ncbi:MAG: FMN-binding protein [Gammaproteobacteria bacterium]|nr:FMN-binding protein [Gammaproteobacteria bacterium]
MRPLLRNVAALAVLTLFAGAVLAWFAEVTGDEVARNRLEAQTRILRELIGVETGAGDRAPWRARQGRPYGALGNADLVLCDRDLVVLRAAGSGYGGGFRLAVALDLDGTIQGVRVLEHAETPGFGDILNMPSAWLDSFTTGDVHAVTGATITSEAVMAAVERAVRRVRLEEICPESNESVRDGLVRSRASRAATP